MRHLDLFSGIGGFALAAEMVWGGAYKNVGFCDNEQFSQKILKKHWPKSKIYGDIKQLNGKNIGAVDLITGGFPCQPFSQAGERKGTEDDRYLWPEMLRIIREVSPRWVVGENVRGLTNWNGGLVFDQVQADLEAQGYKVLPFLLPACAVNAPHRRDRIWFIANRNSIGHFYGELEKQSTKTGKHALSKFIKRNSNATNSDGPRWKRKKNERDGRRNITGDAWRLDWVKVATKFCRMDDGISYRVDRLKALGNAIVPQVAMQIFKAIKEIDKIV